MMHKAWSSIKEVPYCFSRSYVKFKGHTALKIVEFDPNWAFPDSNSSLNSPMAMKCCTKLETAKERCPIVFQGHPSNFKVTRDKTSPNLTQIGHFRTIGRLQLSNPSDLPCLTATKQLYEWSSPSVCLSVHLSVCHTFLTMFPSSYHHEIFMSYYQRQKWHPCRRSSIVPLILIFWDVNEKHFTYAGFDHLVYEYYFINYVEVMYSSLWSGVYLGKS